MFKDIFFGLIIGFFIETLLVNLMKLAIALIALTFRTLNSLIKLISNYINQRQINKQNNQTWGKKSNNLISEVRIWKMNYQTQQLYKL